MINFISPPPLMTILKKNLILLPTPSNISTMWNFGFLLAMILVTQIATGLFLAIHYTGDVTLAFQRVNSIIQETNGGWFTRIIHANGARAFFIGLYLHAGRGIYYGSFYSSPNTWNSGVTILLLVMATAFIGYVLPWGQISFWGATVITNLFSAIPKLGREIVTWLWGGFAVDNATLTRFFTFHFLVPFLILGLVIIHLVLLHETGSTNPLGITHLQDKVPFHPYFLWKDALSLIIFFFLLLVVVLFYPWTLGDPENFIPANPLVTPAHIQPEWYFLFAYAILRSIPNKLGGVIALIFSVMFLYTLRINQQPSIKRISFFPISKFYFWTFVSNFWLLTWIGARPVESPFIELGQTFTVFYFLYFFTGRKIKRLETKLIYRL